MIVLRDLLRIIQHSRIFTAFVNTWTPMNHWTLGSATAQLLAGWRCWKWLNRWCFRSGEKVPSEVHQGLLHTCSDFRTWHDAGGSKSILLYAFLSQPANEGFGRFSVFAKISCPGFVGSISCRSWRSPLAGAGLCVQVAKRRYFLGDTFLLEKCRTMGFGKYGKWRRLLESVFLFLKSSICVARSQNPADSNLCLRNRANPISDIFACPTGRLEIKNAHWSTDPFDWSSDTEWKPANSANCPGYSWCECSLSSRCAVQSLTFDVIGKATRRFWLEKPSNIGDHQDESTLWRHPGFLCFITRHQHMPFIGGYR